MTDLGVNTTYDLDNVEIFEVGTWNGDKYTEKDLDDIVESFNEIGGKLKPFIKLGHDEKQTLLQKDGLPAAGWITDLRRNGKKLLAKFSGMPQKIYDLARNGAYKRVSSEIFWNLKDGEKNYRRALRAVALLGGDTPAVNSLDDFISLYTEYSYDDIKMCNIQEEDIQMEEKDMKKYTDAISDLEAKLKESDKKVSDKDSEIKSYKEEVDKKLEEIEQEKAEMFSQSVEKYLDDQMTDGKVTPVQKNTLMALCSNIDGVKVYSYEDGNEKKSIEGNSFELIKMFLDEQEEIVPVGEKSKHVEVEKGETPDDEKHYEAAKEYAEKHSVDYTTALRAVLSEQEE